MGHGLQRRAPFFLYVAVTVTLAGCVVYFGWVRTWSSVYVPTMYPPFADMRVIRGAVRSVEQGLRPAHCQRGRSVDLMLVGAAIYVGTFILSSNWDYRLIFLVFCIPFLQQRPFPCARAVILVILPAMMRRC